jgi:hypothetical protein
LLCFDFLLDFRPGTAQNRESHGMLHRQKGVLCGRPSLNEAGQKTKVCGHAPPPLHRASSVHSPLGSKADSRERRSKRSRSLAERDLGTTMRSTAKRSPARLSAWACPCREAEDAGRWNCPRNLHPNRSVQRGNGNVASESRLPGRNVHRGGKVMSLQGKVPMRQKTHPKKEITAGAGVPPVLRCAPWSPRSHREECGHRGSVAPRSRLHKEFFGASLGGFLQGKFHRTVVTPFSRPFPKNSAPSPRRGAGTTPAPPEAAKTIRSTAGEGPSLP